MPIKEELKMANTHLNFNEEYRTEIMDELLANDVRNQLQSDINEIIWFRCNSANCYSTKTPVVVVIGNDEIPVIAFRSYETVVAFFYDGIIYEIGKYLQTTSSQIGRYFRNQVLRGFHVIDKIFYKKLS